jgi:hypothetical protein
MTDEPTAAADGQADAKRLQQAEGKRAAAEASAAAQRAHEEAMAALNDDHQAALSRLDALRAQLLASFEKANADPAHVGYAQAFARDVALKGAEILAWINRHL